MMNLNVRPAPRRLSERERVVRATNELRAMLHHVRTWTMPQQEDLPPGRQDLLAKGDRGVCFAIYAGIEQGVELEARLSNEVPLEPMRPSRGLAAFMDLVFAIKLEFFMHLREADQDFPA